MQWVSEYIRNIKLGTEYARCFIRYCNTYRGELVLRRNKTKRRRTAMPETALGTERGERIGAHFSGESDPNRKLSPLYPTDRNPL